MSARAKAIALDNDRRMRLAVFLGLFLFLAQILFAAHSDAAIDHAPQSCEYCLAAAVSSDPEDLMIEVPTPEVSFERARRPAADEIVAANALYSANPRAPPFC